MEYANSMGSSHNHLVGWLAIMGNDSEHDLNNNINLGLDSFVGDYGLIKEIKTTNGFGVGFRIPEVPPPLTVWSFYEDEQMICFIEGIFYDEKFCRMPTHGENNQLANLFVKEFNDVKNKAIEKLNGAFSGFVYDVKTKELTTFVDRFGVRILYWTSEKDSIIISSNLAAFRCLKALSLDLNAAFQFLTIGFPIGERTLLKDISIQLPCTMNSFKGPAKKSIRYWDVSKRNNSISLIDSVEMISNSMENLVDNIYSRDKQTFGLALSGGHDSRLILSALSYKSIPFIPFILRTGNFDEKVSKTLCSIIKKSPIIVRERSDSELAEIRDNTFTYTDGSYWHPAGFSNLAKECMEHQTEYLFNGFAGDVISGSSIIPDPQYCDSISKLANYALAAQMELLSFEDAYTLLSDTNSDAIQETESDWMESFCIESSQDTLMDVAIWQRMSNRNFKRIRFAFAPMTKYTQIIYPYLDNKLLDAYFSVPIQFISHQKAHCYAGFHRFIEFGDLPACNYSLSLKKEANYSLLLYLMRSGYSKLQRWLPKRQAFKPASMSNDNNKIYKEISKSPLFNSVFLKELYFENKIKTYDLRNIYTLKRFHDFYVCGINSAL